MALVAGATGTGKTVSLMVLAEGFSRLGVPVFMADVKGDVAGLALPGSPNENIRQRAAMAQQAARTVGSQIGRQILRGVLGGILGGSRR